MGFFDKLRARVRSEPAKMAVTLSDLNSFFGTRYSTDLGTDISEITYFTCLKVLSEGMGKLSLNLEDGKHNRVTTHDSYYVTRLRANPYMSAYTFKLFMEYCRNHYGNSYAYIRRVGSKLEGLYPLDPRSVEILVDYQGQLFSRPYYYRYSDPKSGRSYLLHPDDVIHLKGGLTRDGLCGQCIRETLARNMEGNKAAQNVLNTLYNNGMTANAVIKYVGDFDLKRKQQLVKELENFTVNSKDRFIPLPIGMDIVPLDLKLTDTQFYELKKFSSLQIAAAFGIKPDQLNNYDKSSYSSGESQRLAFYVDTLLPIISGWEQEFDYKLLTRDEIAKGYGFTFNVSTILRGDTKTQMEVITGYVGAGIYQVNEARNFTGLTPVEKGDVNLINGTNTKLEDIGAAYKPQTIGKGAEKNE